MKDENLLLEAMVTAEFAKKWGPAYAVGVHNAFVNKHFNKYYMQLPESVRHAMHLDTLYDYQHHQAVMWQRYASLYYGVNGGKKE